MSYEYCRSYKFSRNTLSFICALETMTHNSLHGSSRVYMYWQEATESLFIFNSQDGKKTKGLNKEVEGWNLKQVSMFHNFTYME